MKRNYKKNQRPSKSARISQAVILSVSTLFAYAAYTDYVGTLANRIFIDPESIPVVADGYQVGDVFSYIAESTPDPGSGSTVGAGAWNTLYVPPGVEVVGAEIVESDGDGTYSAVPALQVAPIKDGCGGRGCAFPTTGNIQNGKLNESQQDSGIFYSTDPRTAILLSPFIIKPTGSGDQEAWNEWDYLQILAFGSKTPGALSANGGKGNTPVVDTTLSGGGAGAVWAGTGSPVAGPDTYFTNDYAPKTCPSGTDDSNFDAGDLICVGPWNRITYMGDTIGGSPTVMPTIIDGAVPNNNTSISTSSGVSLSEFSPLPSNTNAVRYVVGKRVVGELENIRITFRITDAAAFTASLTDDSFCYDATGGDTDKDGVTGRGAQDNIWRYYEGDIHSCFQGTSDAIALKSLLTVQGNPSPGSADANDIIGYEMIFTNTGNMPLYDINFSDSPTTPGELALIAEGTSGLCPYPSYDGDSTGGTPTLNTLTATSATWNELPALGPGETVTVQICAQVDNGANFGDVIRNQLTVSYATTDGGIPETPLTSEAQIVVSTVISGAVYLDPDSSGYPTGTGDTGIEGVTVQLYRDENGDGLLDAGDTFLDSDTTNATGSYSFVGQNDGDDYLVVETGLSDLLNTGDKDNPTTTDCAAGNGCDVIDFTLNGSSTLNDFMNVGASIGDFIYNDTDNSGTVNAGDTGIDGVTVNLYQDINGDGMIDGGDIVLDTQTTSGGGAYDFTALAPGNYIVDVTDTGSVLTGLTNTSANDPLAVTVSAGQDFNDADFGYLLIADLFIIKSDTVNTVDTYTPGDTGSYTITVGNNGPGNVTGITVSDTLPAGLTLTGPVTCVATGAASCTASVGVATDTSFSDTVVTVEADPTGTVNFVTYTIPVVHSVTMTDY